MTLKNTSRSTNILIALIVSASVSCKGPQNITVKPIIVPDSSQKEQPVVIQIPTDTTDPAYAGLNNTPLIFRFYQLMNHEPVWFEKQTRSSLADTLISFIGNARYYGLLRQNYQYEELIKQTDQNSQQARTDVLLTDAFLTAAEDLKFGRNHAQARVPNDSIRISLLMNVLRVGGLKKTLEAQEPAYPEYHSLKHAMSVILDSVNQYDRHLLLEGSVSESIKMAGNVKLIEINFERWRRENSVFGDRYVFINIPSFMLYVVDKGQVILESKVIVGTGESPTPPLSSIIECFTLYPYWHVPRKIATEEFLPIIKRDTSFIRRNNFDVTDRRGKVLNADSINWSKFTKNYFPVALRQREGPQNSLGLIKFLFDNPYAVFLHDTNSKSLFRREVRAFSHGCIRMERAFELAHYLTTGSIDRKSNMIEKYIEQKQRHTINVLTPIPIHVRYLTCEIRNDILYMFEDLYNEDGAIRDLLYSDNVHSRVFE